jgi:hypothetical protein
LGNKLKNYNYPKAVRLRIILPIIGFLWAFIIGLLMLPYVLGFYILFSLGLAACLILLFGTFVLRPTFVEITDDGLMFYYHWNKTRYVEWGAIRSLWLNPGDLSTYTGSDARRGVLCDLKWHYFKMNYEVAKEVEKAYIEKMGKDPPRDTEGWSQYALP